MKSSVKKNSVKKSRGRKMELSLKDALIASEIRYRRLFESAKDGILIIDAGTGKIIDVNPFLVDLLGYSKKEFIGKEIWEFGIFKDIAVNKEKFLELKKKEYIRYDNLPLETTDGRKINVEFVSNVYLANKKNVIQCNIRDITERKKSETALSQSEEKFRSYIDNAPDGVFVTNENGRYIEVNKAACKMTGYSKDELLKMSISDILTEKSLERGLSQFKMVTHIGTSKADLTFKLKDGSKRWWSLDGVKLTEKRFLGFTKDITERKLAEKELMESKEKAEESDRLKSAFLANMSHEIRTPMNGILGFTGLLKEPFLTGEVQQEYIEIIEKSGARMLNIINDIINISKIESGQMEIFISDTNINEQIEDIFNFFRQEAEQKKLNIFFKSPLSIEEAIIKTDKEKVFAVLSNLVKNAIKFTDSGFIEFGYDLVKLQHAAYLQFYVKDTGIGVPRAQKESIFERFRQGSELLTRNYEGAGLGLSISKAYVEFLGGKIWIDSDQNIIRNSDVNVKNGSTFLFTIPYNPVLEEKTTDKQDVANRGIENQIKKLKLLIAEDDKISQTLITTITRRIVREVIKVGTGYEAVEACQNNPDIDLILMDIKMPEMDGYEATRKIRKFNKEVTIIAQTAYGLAGDKEKAINAGCDDYISKPIDPVKLLNMIKSVLLNGKAKVESTPKSQ